MGILGFLKFALICIDFLAWPVIALGYPLFASIKAVETGSKYHMRKLVIYWTLFALFSLFEFAFIKIIQWIPFWSRIRLIAIFWLVMPQFDGASHAYQRLVHPVLSVNVQAVIDKLHKPKEEEPRKRETFLDVAKEYIKENGSEALEKLIASKQDCKECINSERDVQVLEPEEKNAATTSEQLKEPDAAQHENEKLGATNKSAATEANQLKEPDAAQHENERLGATNKSAATEANQGQYAQSKSAAGVPKGKDAAAAKIKETTSSEPSAENRRLETPPIQKAQQEWICVLCNVTTTSEKTLNAHLHGSKHKSKCESLKASMLHAEDTRSTSSASGKSNRGNVEAVKNKVGQGSQQKQAKPKHGGGANQKFKLQCNVCDVRLLSDIDLASHIKGKRHLANLEGVVS